MATSFETNKILTTPRTINGRVIVETYRKEALQSEVKNGFAMIGQKIRLRGLRVLIDASLPDGTLILAGAFAYVREEHLHTQQWAQKTLECSEIEGPFLIVDMSHVEFFSPVAK